MTPARRWLALSAIAVGAAGAWAVLVTRRSPADATPHAPPPVPVVAVTARRGDLPVTLEGIGSVTPLATVTVRSRVDGQLMQVFFREGQQVRAGDPLAEIDPRPFQVQLEQAQGALARDQALLANANLDLARYRRLVATDSIPHQQLDTQAALVRQYEGIVQADQAQVDDANLQLTYAHVTAPISGRLGLRLVDPGNIVHAADPGGLVVITQISPIAVVFTIPEDSLPPVLAKLHAGAELPVEAYDRANVHPLASGRLLTVDNAVDANTGTVRLKAEFANADGALFPNQFVNARLQLDVRPDVVIVPGAAVQRGTQGPFVYVVTPAHTVDVRPVTLGGAHGDEVAVASGVMPGDLVVVEGAEGVRAGRAVTLRDASSATPAPAGT